MVPLIISTLILSAITGAVFSNEEGSYWGVAGQILHGLLILTCLGLVGVAFWRFGWKIGVVDLVLTFIAGNVGLALREHLGK